MFSVFGYDSSGYFKFFIHRGYKLNFRGGRGLGMVFQHVHDRCIAVHFTIYVRRTTGVLFCFIYAIKRATEYLFLGVYLIRKC